MAVTRSMTRNRTEKRRIYAQRVRSSLCRKLTTAKCRRRRKTKCKYAMGPKRSFCRKRKNQRS
jgi:hypothetical protein